jgi:DNA-binding Lrp family transcriptional regulator
LKLITKNQRGDEQGGEHGGEHMPSIDNNIESYKPVPNTSPNTVSNDGVNYTVGQISGINRTKQPYSSGIYTVSIEAPRKEGDIFAIEKGDIQKTPLKPPGYLSFRRYRKLHIHRLDAIVEINNNIDKDTVARDLLKILNYETPKEKHTTGKAFTTWVYKEKRGESITISLNHKTNKYTVRITTHKLQRLKDFLDYAYTVLRIDKVRTLMIETYVRYLERYELKIAKALEALDLELGKGIRQHLIPSRGKHDYYLSRAKLEYKGSTAVLKTYRHATYRRHKPTDPEYHPKIEQLTVLKETPITINIESVIREYATLLYTILYTINPRIILGDYEINETETIEVHAIDKQIQRYIRGITKRLKAEIILEEQYPDKRMAIAKLLVEKKMKITEIAKLLGYSKRHTLRIIEELIDAGIIKRVKRGVYEWANKSAKLEKKQVIESRQMTLQQLIEFAKERKARLVHDRGTAVIEVEDEYTIRRIIISDILIEEDRIIEQLAGRTRIYKIPRNRLRQLITT